MNTQVYREHPIQPSITLRRRLQKVSGALDYVSPAGDLILRCWAAYAFFVSGLTKIQTWDSTVYLFENEYSVPLLPPVAAAYLGTTVELGFPVLLSLGLMGRFAAFALFLFNIAAVISYPDLGAAGLEQHTVWGIMLLVQPLARSRQIVAGLLAWKTLFQSRYMKNGRNRAE